MDYDAITKQLLNDIPPWQGKPFYALAAGGPASHKCFLSILLEQQKCTGFISINDELLAPFFPASTSSYPHNEKSAEHIKDYYTLVSHIVEEAKDRGISVILEDHGDYPEIYKRHLKTVNQADYDTFLLMTTISPKNFDSKCEYLIKNAGMPDFREWGKAYHQRIAQKFEGLLDVFDKGMLIETQPAYISPDNLSHAHSVMRFDHSRIDQPVEILDDERYKAFQTWKEHTNSADFRDYFKSADEVVESGIPGGSFTEGIRGSRPSRNRADQEGKSILERIVAPNVESQYSR